MYKEKTFPVMPDKADKTRIRVVSNISASVMHEIEMSVQVTLIP
jgi:hypothetical protein